MTLDDRCHRRSWQAKETLRLAKEFANDDPDSDIDPFGLELPSAQPVATAPKPAPAPKTKKAPRGLPFLRGNRAGPDEPPA